MKITRSNNLQKSKIYYKNILNNQLSTPEVFNGRYLIYDKHRFLNICDRS